MSQDDGKATNPTSSLDSGTRYCLAMVIKAAEPPFSALLFTVIPAAQQEELITLLSQEGGSARMCDAMHCDAPVSSGQSTQRPPNPLPSVSVFS